MDEYQPPDPGVYDNVKELNHAWLRATTDLRGPQRARLADAPFLLFSLREHDLDWWRMALAEDLQADWLQRAVPDSEPIRRIQSAALGFLWQLALTNPYAARLVCGASTDWCELLVSVPLVKLIERVADRPDLCTSRINADASAFPLADCTSEDPKLRRTSHFATLQSLLTTPIDCERQLPAAACRMPRLQLQVADRPKE